MVNKNLTWPNILGTMAVIGLLTSGTVAYSEIKSDIREGETRQEESDKQNTERYVQIQKQLNQILTHILKNKND